MRASPALPVPGGLIPDLTDEGPHQDPETQGGPSQGLQAGFGLLVMGMWLVAHFEGSEGRRLTCRRLRLLPCPLTEQAPQFARVECAEGPPERVAQLVRAG